MVKNERIMENVMGWQATGKLYLYLKHSSTQLMGTRSETKKEGEREG